MYIRPEIFLLPYYIFTQPETARKLEEYRYLSLPGAHKKAEHNGYRGAMFPWESAWLDDGEVTPEYQGVDIVTGLLIKVWSGEWGHMNVEGRETDICGCGNCGCLEQYASARGIVRYGKWMLKESYKTSKLREMECFNAKDICDLARNGEEMALDILEGSCTYLGKAMCAIAEVVDPEVFLIGGGMSRAGDILLEKIKEGYEKFSIPVIKDIPIKIAELSNDAGIFGCTKIVLD